MDQDIQEIGMKIKFQDMELILGIYLFILNYLGLMEDLIKVNG
jgi:hypothetical protein